MKMKVAIPGTAVRVAGRIFILLLTSTAVASEPAQQNHKAAIFAGGCFWSMEADFEQAPGVLHVISGYTGGNHEAPTYDDYSETGHIEAIQVTYDPAVINYRQLLEYYWIHIDPTDPQGQFCDRGHEYSSAIFYLDDEQKHEAEASKYRLGKSGILDKKVATSIVKAKKFYPAEEDHQDYYKKNQYDYKLYRAACRRDHRLDELWDDIIFPTEFGNKSMQYRKYSEQELEEMLTDQQYYVTQQDGTEPAFSNEYWDNTKEGIYVDVVSGEPLFSSQDKYKSGTGWPSFTRPLEPANIIYREDQSWSALGVEIRSRHADSHLGHVFEDGPDPAGLRYCLNSAAMRFIAREDLAKNGYARYLKYFE
jgi:peptide methionine sulfoxide reductase msrA/msrB